MPRTNVFAEMYDEVERVPLSSSDKEVAPLDWARLISYIPRGGATFVTPLTKVLRLDCDSGRSKVSKESRDARFQNAGMSRFR